MTDLTPYVGEIIKNTTLQLCQALAERDTAIAERDRAQAAVGTLTRQISEMAQAASQPAAINPAVYASDGDRDLTSSSPPIV